jgi:mannose-6-phosphate isomerase-like protein (cupin superfamily)
MAAHDLETTYLGLAGDGAVTAMLGGPEFWNTVATKPDEGGYLVTVSVGKGDWTTWEMHPQGDEVLVALEGEGRMILEHPDGRLASHAMATGSMLVIPKGAWHRGVGQRGLKLLFITWGSGTTHRPVTEADLARG